MRVTGIRGWHERRSGLHYLSLLRSVLRLTFRPSPDLVRQVVADATLVGSFTVAVAIAVAVGRVAARTVEHSSDDWCLHLAQELDRTCEVTSVGHPRRHDNDCRVGVSG